MSARKECRELIPGIEGRPDVHVRVAFWEINYLTTLGWTITKVSRDRGGSVVAVNPFGKTVTLAHGGMPQYPYAPLVLMVALLAHLDDSLGLNLIQQLSTLAEWLNDQGPIPEPDRFSTVSELDLADELVEAYERRQAAGMLPRYRDRVSTGLGRQLLGGFGTGPLFKFGGAG